MGPADEGFGEALATKPPAKRESKHYDAMWQRGYETLKKFKKKNGHCYVSRVGADEYLAGWKFPMENIVMKPLRKFDDWHVYLFCIIKEFSNAEQCQSNSY